VKEKNGICDTGGLGTNIWEQIIMKNLNFYPYYEPYIRSRAKTTTFRIAERAPFQTSNKAPITIGWEESNAVPIGFALIREVYQRTLRDLTEDDFEGESPDCRSVESAKLVLSCIYKVCLNDNDKIWVVKFEHVSGP